MGTGEFNAAVTLRCTTIPSRGSRIILIASSYGNRDKLRSNGPLGSYADLNLFLLFLSQFSEGSNFRVLSHILLEVYHIHAVAHKLKRKEKTCQKDCLLHQIKGI